MSVKNTGMWYLHIGQDLSILWDCFELRGDFFGGGGLLFWLFCCFIFCLFFFSLRVAGMFFEDLGKVSFVHQFLTGRFGIRKKPPFPIAKTDLSFALWKLTK